MTISLFQTHSAGPPRAAAAHISRCQTPRLRPAGRCLLAVLLGWALAGGPPAARAQRVPVAAVSIGDVQVGWAGKYKVGYWTPLRVQLQAGERPVTCRLQWTTVDGEGLPVRSQSEPMRLAPGEAREWEGSFRAGRLGHPLLVQVTVEGTVVDSRTVADGGASLTSDTRLVVSLGSHPNLQSVLATRQSRTGQSIELVSLATAASLPRHAPAYDAVDLLVLTADPAALDGLDESSRQALEQWLHLGGRLLLSGARQGERVWAQGQMLANLVPGRFVGTVPQRETSGLETYVGADESLDQYRAPGDLSFQVPLARVEEADGQVVVWEGFGEDRRATIIQAAAGLGRVVFVGYDLDQFPFTEWKGTERLFRRLLDLAWEPADFEAQQTSGQITHVGYSDLTGQLRAAMDHFRAVRLVPFSLVALLVGIYVALIGPIDYLVLRRWGNPIWTWLTSLAIVVAFCLLAYLLHGLWKGSELRLNQVDLVDWDASSGYYRSTSWLHLYSPRSDKYDLNLQFTAPLSASLPDPQGTVITWQGLPGASFGGMDTGNIRMGVREGYRLELHSTPSETTGRLLGFPILVSSSRSMLGRIWGRENPGQISGLSANSDGQLTGWINNVWPVDLQRCWLVYDRWLYDLQELAAGERFTLQSSDIPKSLELVLTQRQVIGGKDVGTPWDRQGTDVGRIMEMLMFHSAAGGPIYTRLSHRYQDEIDLSGHLRLGRAVLVGHAARRATELERQAAGQPMDPDRVWSIYRLVVPVAGS